MICVVTRKLSWQKFFNSINKASKLQKCNSDALTLAKKVAYLCGIELSTVAPKPRAEGSSQLTSHKECTLFKKKYRAGSFRYLLCFLL